MRRHTFNLEETSMRNRNSLLPVFILISAVTLSLLFSACGRDNKQAYLNATTPAPVASVPVEELSCDASAPTDVVAQIDPADGKEYFRPQVITKPVNSVVKWTNNDIGTTNNYWIKIGTFESIRVAPGGSICIRFTQPGTYNYHCDPGVGGTVILEPAK
jgi:plastocyanin